ncbi:hypothetical protein ACJMK2_024660 [Sinanodonta woodiana]|uniref:Uncharacterized protein n=1 Tax=Sinanodonta woodiana TaxID=1069815 RepID=A0ABD3XE21_SINWO
MNDENITQLCTELDKLLPLIPPRNVFTSEWLEQEYLSVTLMRDQGKPSYRNEYRIIKLLIESRTKELLKNKDNLALFVPAGTIIRYIENSIKEKYHERVQAKSVNAELEKLLNIPLYNLSVKILRSMII